jgi:uncharacterized protein YjbI with pentapeptide repeats
MENSYRATLAQILGGIVVGIGIYFAWGNLRTAREGQITERFTRAIDQLGNPSIEIRLGGIYALERISNESKEDHWPTMEILTAYVKKNVSIKNPYNLPFLKSEDVQNQNEVSLDIQAILTVIGRRRCSVDVKNAFRLNLNHTFLKSADLRNANLEWASLSGTNFECANLRGANLKHVHLLWANLKSATFSEAYLEGIDLSYANCEYAYLSWADLKGAKLGGADLKGADLNGADLKGANLKGANLKGAKNLTVDQLSEVKTLYGAKLNEELDKLLREKYPTLFKKPKDEP